MHWKVRVLLSWHWYEVTCLSQRNTTDSSVQGRKSQPITRVPKHTKGPHTLYPTVPNSTPPLFPFPQWTGRSQCWCSPPLHTILDCFLKRGGSWIHHQCISGTREVQALTLVVHQRWLGWYLNSLHQLQPFVPYSLGNCISTGKWMDYRRVSTTTWVR